MTGLAIDRPWLIKMQCTNHQTELPVKGAFDKTTFIQRDTFYIANFAVLKNAGKIKREIKAAAQTFIIKHCALPKLRGTHFVGHPCNAYTRLLALWPSITMAYENVIADGNNKIRYQSYSDWLLDKVNIVFFLMSCVYVFRYPQDYYTNILGLWIGNFSA